MTSRDLNSVREALILGVPEHGSDKSLNLPVVHNDLEVLHRVLEDCRYKVTSRGVENPAEATRNNLHRFIREQCAGASEGGTLLIYFSGHGLHHQGKDYLIPHDADLGSRDLADTLVRADIGHLVADSRASTVAFFVDACREGVEWRKAPDGLSGWTRQQYEFANGRCFVTIFACSEGQYSQYVGGEKGFSLFTRALATVLSTDHPARTLGEVVKAAQVELDRLVIEHGKQKQTIVCKSEQSVEKDWRVRVVTDLRSAPGPGRAVGDWATLTAQSRIWTLCPEEDEPKVSLFREAVASLTAEAVEVRRSAERDLPADPWRDDRYLGRFLENLEILVQGLEAPPLVAAEAGLLLLAPLIHEVLYTRAALKVAGCDPLTVEPLEPEETKPKEPRKAKTSRGHDGTWEKLRLVHRMRPRLVRASARLAKGNPAERERGRAIAAWLMNEFISREPSFWQAGALGISVVRWACDPARRGQPGVDLVAETLRPSRLVELARCVGCDPGRIEHEDGSNPLRPVAVATVDGERIEVREQLLGYLLAVAGWMTLDVRTFPEFVADAIGGSSGIKPSDFLKTIGEARWNSLGTGRKLDAVCSHPEVDFALKDHVRRAAEAMEFVRVRAHDVAHLAPLKGLPTRLGDNGVRPSTVEGGGRGAYELPHISFTLAPEEIRELLMGQQLYSEPELSIRELYQNALDACRYRRARIEFLKRKGECPPSSKDWAGKIEFTQGKSDDGRWYIECRDNGVGMGKSELAGCFAKAGRRFRDLPEFLEEREQWLNADPPIRIYPNSQFGIGVFSYFMLADELEVETCRFDRQGSPGQRILARMSAGGGLFRVQDLGHREGEPEPFGSRVRLYTKTKLEAGKLAGTIREFLCVSEFLTTVKDGRFRLEWKPNSPSIVLMGIGPADIRPAVIASHSVEPHVWWGPVGTGKVLSDGIRVNSFARPQADHLALEVSEKIEDIGAIVSMAGEQMPVLTVDRKSMLNCDWQWASKAVARAINDLADSPHLTMAQLWYAHRWFPETLNRDEVIRRVGKRLIPVGSHDRRIGTRSPWSQVPRIDCNLPVYSRLSVPLADVGIDWLDSDVLSIVSTYENKNWKIVHTMNQPLFYDVVDSIIWLLKERDPVSFGDFEGLRMELAALPRPILFAVYGKPSSFLDRLEVWAGAGLVIPPSLMADLSTAGELDDPELIRNMRKNWQRKRTEKLIAGKLEIIKRYWFVFSIWALMITVLPLAAWKFPKIAAIALVFALNGVFSLWIIVAYRTSKNP